MSIESLLADDLLGGEFQRVLLHILHLIRGGWLERSLVLMPHHLNFAHRDRIWRGRLWRDHDGDGVVVDLHIGQFRGQK